MATCAYCGNTILFGGIRDESLRFCSKKCQQKGYGLHVAEQIPDNVVLQKAGEIHRGLCPECSGNGPVDVHTSYRVYSLLLFTSWSNRPHLCCRSCATKKQIGDALISLLFGWWGFPWGLIMTPVQIVRNLVGLTKSPDPLVPSDQLTKMTRLMITSHVLQQE
jgi:hypothetical protein